MSVFRVGSNKSSVNNFPSVRPTLDLDFANSKTLDPRITFTRASGGTYVGADGLIKYAGVNEARFDHDPETGESLGLLIEESRSNIIPYSEDFSRSDWVTFGTASKSSNVITAPDGNPTADSITIPTSSGVYDNIAASPNTTYTFSSYIKGTPGTTVKILLNFNVSGFTSKTVTVSDVWQRFNVTVTSGASDANVSVQYDQGNDDQGNGNTFYVWGAQLEVGAFPTSYIPTEGSTRTRAADDASITGKNFREWYRQDEGTFITKAKYDGIPISGLANRASFATISTEGTIASWTAWWDSGNYAVYVVENPQNTYQAILTSGLISINQTKKTASAYKLNDFAFTADGASPSLDTSGTVPSNAKLFIGSLNGTAWSLDGTISRLTYFPKRLTNEQLQALTK
jgi:hypothetical protein